MRRDMLVGKAIEAVFMTTAESLILLYLKRRFEV